mmetsp:Transcript_9995/g.17980  ORF Transcript_9995/g.17980 Transcript_9995/m.17980 type:complete len:209 (+) Transcript_9995:831-1457(+)
MTLTRRPLLSLVTLLSGITADDIDLSGLVGLSMSFFRFAMAANLPPLAADGEPGASSDCPDATSSIISSLTLGWVNFSLGLVALSPDSALAFAFSSDSVDSFFSSASTGSFFTCTSFDTSGVEDCFASASDVFFFSSFTAEFLASVESLAGPPGATLAPEPSSFLDPSLTAAAGFESSLSSSLITFKQGFFTTIPCFSLYSITSFGTT